MLNGNELLLNLSHLETLPLVPLQRRGRKENHDLIGFAMIWRRTEQTFPFFNAK